MQTIWVGRVRDVFRLQGTFQHTVGGGAICLNIITFYAQFNLENECLKFFLLMQLKLYVFARQEVKNYIDEGIMSRWISQIS